MASAATPEFPFTKETTNYARLCRLLVDVGSQALRDTFDAIHPPGRLPTVLGRHPVHAKLTFLKDKRVLNETQWEKLYPVTPSSVSSVGFDITLLMVLLRNICGLAPPSTGWDSLPPSTDLSKQANIARLKYYRNTVYGHASQASVDDVAFNNYWQEISNAIVGLVGARYGDTISNLKNKCMDLATEENYRQLLKQWKEDKDNVKEKLQEIEDKVTNDFDWMRTEVGNLSDKLDTLMARQHGAQDQEKMTNDIDQMRSEIGNIQDKLSSLMMARQEETQHQGDVKNYLDQIKIDVGNMSQRLDDLVYVAQQRETKQQEFSTRNDKINVRRSKITKEGEVLMVQNVPLRVVIPPKALPTCTEITCSIWNLQILSPPLGRNEALVSSVMELACGSPPGTEKRYKFHRKVKLALSHSASDIKGYEFVIKELINEKTNDWRDLETIWAWTPLDIKDEHSRLEEYPDWLFPFAEAEITSCSSFAVVWRLKSFTFKNCSTLSSSFPCILSDHPGVSVTFPESSLPTGKTFALTAKVQEVPCSNAILKERLVAGPILHISPSEQVQLLAPARLTIPVTLREDTTKCPNYSATDVRIFCRTSEDDEREWNEVTEQLENIAVLENGIVTFTVNHFSEYWVWIDPFKRSFVVLKNLADSLCRKLMSQRVGFFARLYARGKPTSYLLNLYCFPLHLKEQVYTPLSPVPHSICAEGGGNSLKPLCKEDQMSVSLSEAFTVMQGENLDNFLTFFGTEPFERSLPVSVSDLSNLHVKLYMEEQFNSDSLCKLYLIPTFPDQSFSPGNFPSTTQVAIPEQEEDQVALELSTAFPSPEAAEETDSNNSSKEDLKVTILADEWNSLKGGLSTFNRELAIHLASRSETQVTLLVPHGACGEEEKGAAAKERVTIIEAKKRTACASHVELFFPPKNLRIDVVIGHGVKLGQQAQQIRESHNCKWVQVVHTAPDELGMYKDYPKAITQSEEKNQCEVSLCRIADLVMAVGPKLKGFYSNRLRSFDEEQKVVEFTPGIIRDLTDVKLSPNENDEFQVLMFGRGDDEDFELKGYDIAAEAFASHELKDDSYHLTFVGAAPGKQDESAAKICQHGISKNQLTVKEYIKDRNRLKELLLRMDLVIMPSRTEGFGLTALEALSAGLPVLAGYNSGFAKALQNVEFGELCVVNSDDPKDWSKAIKKVRQKERKKRLEEMQRLRESYRQKYNWEEQSKILVREMKGKVLA